MLDTAARAVRLVQGKSLAEFEADEALRLAVTHLVQVIGEAARRLSPEYCERHPSIPWKAIVGMRNKLVHDYLGVDELMVWSTVTRELPELVEQLAKLVGHGRGD